MPWRLPDWSTIKQKVDLAYQIAGADSSNWQNVANKLETAKSSYDKIKSGNWNPLNCPPCPRCGYSPNS